MKKYFVCIIIVLAGSFAIAQRAATNIIQTDRGPFIVTDNLDERTVDFIKKNAKAGNNNISGTPFLNKEWSKGYIRLKNGALATDLLLRYNVYTQQLHFLKDSMELVLQDEISEFGYIDETVERKARLFKTGYPSPDNRNWRGFYEVLLNKEPALLKRYEARLREEGFSSGIVKYKIDTIATWYAYSSVKNQLVKIKKDPHSINTVLNEQAIRKIPAFIQSQHLKMNREQDLITLFESLQQEGF